MKNTLNTWITISDKIKFIPKDFIDRLYGKLDSSNESWFLIESDSINGSFWNTWIKIFKRERLSWFSKIEVDEIKLWNGNGKYKIYSVKVSWLEWKDYDQNFFVGFKLNDNWDIKIVTTSLKWTSEVVISSNNDYVEANWIIQMKLVDNLKFFTNDLWDINKELFNLINIWLNYQYDTKNGITEREKFYKVIEWWVEKEMALWLCTWISENKVLVSSICDYNWVASINLNIFNKWGLVTSQIFSTEWITAGKININGNSYLFVWNQIIWDFGSTNFSFMDTIINSDWSIVSLWTLAFRDDSAKNWMEEMFKDIKIWDKVIFRIYTNWEIWIVESNDWKTQWEGYWLWEIAKTEITTILQSLNKSVTYWYWNVYGLREDTKRPCIYKIDWDTFEILSWIEYKWIDFWINTVSFEDNYRFNNGLWSDAKSKTEWKRFKVTLNLIDPLWNCVFVPDDLLPVDKDWTKLYNIRWYFDMTTWKFIEDDPRIMR